MTEWPEHAAFRRLLGETSSNIADLFSLLEICSSFGIVGGTSELQEELVLPETCMRTATHRLDLFGYGGEKWRDEPWFEPELTRLERRGGKVRFLVSHAALDDTSMQRYAKLESDHEGTFEAWIYEATSIFRLVTVDSRISIFTHYGHEVIDENGRNMRGWHSPQLVIDHAAEWSLSVPLRRVFNNTLQDARRASELINHEPTRRAFKPEA